jgi:hypothetical protein
MVQTTRFAVLAPTNQFTFSCPIFQTDVKMRQCVKLVEVTKVNQKLEVRKGCQACIMSGKCPVDVMSRMISFGNPGVEPDDYASDTPVKGKLSFGLLKRIAPVMVPDRTLNEFGVPDKERDLITSSHASMMKSLPAYESADEAAPKRRRASKSTTEKTPAKAAPATNRINKAAETGDMAAAL